MAAPAFSVSTEHSARLANPALREGLVKFARRRLPAGEVDDLVQSTLTDALASSGAPSGDAEFRRWLQGIARHKIADLYRRRGRLPPAPADADASVVDPGPATGELTQWIERELPKTAGAKATLHWLLRESDGETLDEIARDAEVPAPRVRQRVSRLRRHFQTRWLALGAAGLALLLGLGVGLGVSEKATPAPPSIAREAVSPLDRARALRQSALQNCASAEYFACLTELDEAKALDPVGDQTDAVHEARDRAGGALANEPAQRAPEPKLNPKSAPASKLPAKRFMPKMQKPRPKQELHRDQKALPTQDALPLFDDPPSKSKPGSKSLAPSKD